MLWWGSRGCNLASGPLRRQTTFAYQSTTVARPVRLVYSFILRYCFKIFQWKKIWRRSGFCFRTRSSNLPGRQEIFATLNIYNPTGTSPNSQVEGLKSPNMAGLISAFFHTLLPSTRATESCAPSSLASKCRAGDSTQGSASMSTQEAAYPFTIWKPKSSAATPSTDASGTGTGCSPAGTPEADPEEIRRLRNQFLDKRLTETGKKGRRQPKTFTTPVLR